MKDKRRQFLRLSFLVGGVADALVAVNWFLIASGVPIPNLLSGFVSTGEGYRFAMYIATLFMAGWSAILGIFEVAATSTWFVSGMFYVRRTRTQYAD